MFHMKYTLCIPCGKQELTYAQPSTEMLWTIFVDILCNTFLYTLVYAKLLYFQLYTIINLTQNNPKYLYTDKVDNNKKMWMKKSDPIVS